MADICRKVRRRSFTQIDNEPINDPNLKYEDIGLLTYVMSKPDNWTIYKNELISSHANGRESVASILKRLEERGYLMVIQGRTGKGYFSHNQYIFTDRAFDFGDEYELEENTLQPEMPKDPKPETPWQTKVLSMNGNPSTDNRQRETVNGNPTPNNTINNNTINNNAVAEDDQEKVMANFQKIFGVDLSADIARTLLEYTEEERELIFKILKEKKDQGKIVSPKGILAKDTRSVINRILNGEFYPTIEKDPEIEEFEKHTGLRLRGKSQQSLYRDWRAKFSKEMMFKAGELTAVHSKNGTIDYMVAILKDWEKRNITKPQQVDKKRTQNNNFGEIYTPPERATYIHVSALKGTPRSKLGTEE